MNHSTIVERFVKGATKLKSGNLFIDGDVLYSYGRHFPLLVRMPWGFLQNADKYSVTTSQHQSVTARHADILIPFSALDQIDTDIRYGYAIKFNLIDKTEAVYEDREYTNKDGERVTVQERRPEGCVIEFKDGHQYLASMDNRNYFISELPGKVKTAGEAFDLLRPAELHGKIEGTDYIRQGEFFFIPVPEVKTKDMIAIVKSAKLHNKREGQEPHHYATECGYTLTDVYARGTIRHTRHDHPMAKLGQVWHKVLESNHLLSIGARGRID